VIANCRIKKRKIFNFNPFSHQRNQNGVTERQHQFDGDEHHQFFLKRFDQQGKIASKLFHSSGKTNFIM
jgi:hypothetical protein